MHVLITGATGMVGGSILRTLLDERRVTKITSLSRRSTGLTHPKLVEVPNINFDDPAVLATHMQGIDILFHCIATYAHTVDAETYEWVTVTTLENMLSALKQTTPNAQVVLFSAMGANPKENSWYKALNTKGRAENALWASDFPRRIAFRPGTIIPTRKENNKGILDSMAALLFRILPIIGTTSDELAQVVVDAALGNTPDSTILEHTAIRKRLKEIRA